MKFKDIYNSTINLWPISIDIHDGRLIDETKGFYSSNLSEVWSSAKLGTKNEWQRLMVWTIYQFLHRKAIELFELGNYKLVVSQAINETELESAYFKALQVEGYEDMLLKYLK